MLGACAFAYFAYHAIEGERGLLAWLRMTKEIEVAREVLAEIDAERTALERRVALLTPGHLDPDVLDERARALLDLVGEGEIVVPLSPDPARP
ncbi:MAG: septum formation initiator family protein [Proteobacteria bacterium]|nr:septum formation initiator family protein [Pseudomonadota bacterium]